MRLRCLLSVLSFAVSSCGNFASAVDSNGEWEVIQDRDFQNGFILLNPKPGQAARDGVLPGVSGDVKPAWNLCQWNSKFPLTASLQSLESGKGLLEYRNPAKAISVGTTPQKRGVLKLAANSRMEYGEHARSSTEPWVHLLVEQRFERPVLLSELSGLQFRISARLNRARNLHSNDYTPAAHAAQFQVFLVVQNLNSKSKGHGDQFWFGIPVYDNRSRSPSEFKERDFGGSEKFIFTPDGAVYSSMSAHDGKWLTVDKDLLPLIRDGLHLAWDRGFLKDSKSLGDYYVSGMNMGWELPGTFDVEMEIKGLSLKATPRPGRLTTVFE